MGEKRCGKGYSARKRFKPGKAWVSRVLSVVLAFVLIYAPIAPAANAEGDPVTVTSFDLTVYKVNAGQTIALRLDYADTMNTGIKSGDTIKVKIANAETDIIKLVGDGGIVGDIYGDDPNTGASVVVGTRTYSYDSEGNFYLDILFDGGYESIYGVDMGSAGIVGYYYAYMKVEYKNEVTVETTDYVTVIVNDDERKFTVTATVSGGSGVTPSVNSAGPLISKYARYGAASGNDDKTLLRIGAPNLVDYTKFDTMRWGLSVGFQNLTWRDLRATSGDYYYTTQAALDYSNNNPTGNAYTTGNDSYFFEYQETPDILISSPYFYENAVVDDYLVVGKSDKIYNAHEYLADSVRIIRVLGRFENDGYNYPWWAYRQLADSNFLIADPSEPIDRYENANVWKGYRGLTLNEFLTKMQGEGQFVGKTVDDLLTVDYVDYTESPFDYFYTVPTGTKIAHLQLNLGSMHFGDTTDKVNLVRTDNYVVFSDVPAKYLPYGYMIYYDTKAAEANLYTDSAGVISINYNNEATFTYDNDCKVTGNNAVYVRVENSGGSGNYTTLKIKKVDADGDAVSGIKFTLTQTNVSPAISREVDTNINGTASFTLGIGAYTLTETVPPGSDLEPVEPISFSLASPLPASVDLTGLLPAGYANENDITFQDDTNTIVNHPKSETPTAKVTLAGQKTAFDADGVALPVAQGQFSFNLTPSGNNPAGWSWNQGNPVGVAAGGALNLGTLTFDAAGTYVFTASEIVPSPQEEGWEYDLKDVTITIEVTETAGELEATATYTKDDVEDQDGEAKFVNNYEEPEAGPGGEPGTEPEPKKGTGQIKVSKSISGVNNTALTFTFNTEQVADENGTPLAGGESPIVVAPVSTGGEITRASGVVVPIDLGELAEGTYYFKITEDRSAIPANWTYSGAAYIVKVEVDEDGVTTVTYPDDYSDNNPPVFANSYRSGGGGSSGGGSTPTVTEVTETTTEGDDDGDDDGGNQESRNEEVIVDPGTPEESVEELGITTNNEQSGTGRQTGGGTDQSSQPQTRTPGANLTADGAGFLEIGDDGVALGRWEWDEDQGMWIFNEIAPLGNMPKTGGAEIPATIPLLLGFALIGMGIVWKIKTGKRTLQAK